jgi:hypothetical protein
MLALIVHCVHKKAATAPEIKPRSGVRMFPQRSTYCTCISRIDSQGSIQHVILAFGKM